MADLMADLNATEQKLAAESDELKVPSPPMPDLPPKRAGAGPTYSIPSPAPPEVGSTASSVSSPASSAASMLPPPPPQSAKPTMVSDFSHFSESLNRSESFSQASWEPALVTVVFTRRPLKLRWNSLL